MQRVLQRFFERGVLACFLTGYGGAGERGRNDRFCKHINDGGDVWGKTRGLHENGVVPGIRADRCSKRFECHSDFLRAASDGSFCRQ